MFQLSDDECDVSSGPEGGTNCREEKSALLMINGMKKFFISF